MALKFQFRRKLLIERSTNESYVCGYSRKYRVIRKSTLTCINFLLIFPYFIFKSFSIIFDDIEYSPGNLGVVKNKIARFFLDNVYKVPLSKNTQLPPLYAACDLSHCGS